MKEQEEVQLAQDRLDIIKEIEQLEKAGRFDVDPEKDPPTKVLKSNKVDYLNKKYRSKIKSTVSNQLGKAFLYDLIKTNRLIVKEVKGLENLENIETGAIINCNHFNPFDVFAVEKTYRMTKLKKTKKLYKIIREGNYTNFPGFYGFLFRNSDTLPLSSNKSTMVEFMKSVDTILQRGDLILIYPEQSLWWNYRKPKPLKDGAFNLAVRNSVPIVPIFITMEDSDITGDDGFPVQAYTVNVLKPIYKDENLTPKENISTMKEKNYNAWKEVYEDFYKIPLTYTTKNLVIN